MKISMKKRKIGYTYGSVSGRYPFRGEKTVAYESHLEADMLTVLEFNDAVSDVVEQPFTIIYEDENGKERRYTPDFLVWFRPIGTGTKFLWPDGREVPDPRPMLVEVKPREIIRKKWRELRPKFRAATRYAARNDMIFRIFDESRIRTVFLENVRIVRRYLRFEYSEFEEERLLNWVAALGHCTIDILLTTLRYSTFRERSEGLGHIYSLIARKMLVCDMYEPLGLDTVVWLSDEEYAIRRDEDGE